MYFKVNEIRTYRINKEIGQDGILIADVYRGRILKVDEDNKQYTIEDLETKVIYVLDEEDVFIGDD